MGVPCRNPIVYIIVYQKSPRMTHYRNKIINTPVRSKVRIIFSFRLLSNTYRSSRFFEKLFFESEFYTSFFFEVLLVCPVFCTYSTTCGFSCVHFVRLWSFAPVWTFLLSIFYHLLSSFFFFIKSCECPSVMSNALFVTTSTVDKGI